MRGPEHGLLTAQWTDADYRTMGWHDATVWAFTVERADWDLINARLNPEARLLLDLDYITRWVWPGLRKGPYSFWVTPCTLAFRAVSALSVTIDPRADVGSMVISSIQRVDDRWHIEGHDVEMTFTADSFRQTARRIPVLTRAQSLGLDERGGYSYDETPVDL